MCYSKKVLLPFCWLQAHWKVHFSSKCRLLFLAHKPIQKSIAIKCQMEFEEKPTPPHFDPSGSFQSFFSERKLTDSTSFSVLHTTQIPEIDLMLRQELREVRYINTAGGVFPLFELLSGLGKIDKKWERLMENQNKSTLPSFSRSPKPFFTRVSCSPRLFEDEMNES